MSRVSITHVNNEQVLLLCRFMLAEMEINLHNLREIMQI